MTKKRAITDRNRLDAELLDTAKGFAQRGGVTIKVFVIELEDGFSNRSRLDVSVDGGGFLSYSLGGESLSNLRHHRDLPISAAGLTSLHPIVSVVEKDRDITATHRADFSRDPGGAILRF